MDTNLNNDPDGNEEQIEKQDKENKEIEAHGNTNLEKRNQDASGEAVTIKPQKKQNKFMASTLAVVLMILLLTVASVGSYSPIKENFISTENNTATYIESHNFVYNLSQLTRYLYQSKIQGTDWYDSRYEAIESIQYYITNDDHSIDVSNMPDIEEPILLQEIEKSQFYLYARFDENGNPEEIESSLGRKFNRDAFLNGFIDNYKETTIETTDYDEETLINEEVLDTIDNNEEAVEYANLEIIYIVPEDFENYYDLFTYNMKDYHFSNYMILILIIGAIGILLLIIIAFSIPYSKQKEAAISKLFNKMFLEIKVFLLLGFPILCIGLLSELSNYRYNHVFNIVDTVYSANEYFYLIGIPVTFILYSLIYLSIVYIKYIYHTGFKKGFIENSFVGKIGFHIIRKLRKSLKAIMTIDITKDPHKRIFVILVTNLFILWLIALGGGLAFLLAVIWSVFLFKYFVTLMGQMKALHDASRQLAEGDFTINLDASIGMLSPIAQNLNNIKEGFQLAVDKEIKSRRMKAELISNVSHDLKTPLTSIITYVDLLKNQDISRETQQEYIEILDRKSKRLNVLIEDLFEASKASSGNIDLQLEAVDVIALFRQTLGELEEKINHSNLQMKINAPENKVICKLDGKRTYRVFENIMSNILKYAMANSRVYIDIVEGQEKVSFTFKNISSYEMNFDAAEITERFTRGDESRNTEGSGLGLSIAKSLVELQNGDIEIIIDGDLFKLIVTFPKL